MNTDNEYETLVRRILDFSLSLMPGEKVFIELIGDETPLTQALVEGVLDRGGIPFVQRLSTQELEFMVQKLSRRNMRKWYLEQSRKIERMNVFIVLRNDPDWHVFSRFDADAHEMYIDTYLLPLQVSMVKLQKWCVVRLPHPKIAEYAGVNLDSMKEIFAKGSNGYNQLYEQVSPLVELLRQTDEIRLTGENTDIRFSIKNMPIIQCDGKYNIPDGEVFTAPHLESVNGTITFNIPSQFMGIIFQEVTLKFKNGYVVDVESDQNDRLLRIIHKDLGSSRIGEFGIGLNPYITRPFHDIFWDEKMIGSVHFALGQAYSFSDNGNRSKIHWDLVYCLHEEYGGGNLYFDNKLVVRNRFFELPELLQLNDRGRFRLK